MFKNNKILKVMPFVLGALIIVLVVVLIFMKSGGKNEGEDTEMKTGSVESDLGAEEEKSNEKKKANESTKADTEKRNL